MNEQRGFWQRLLVRSKISPLSQRQGRALQYVISRIDEGVPPQEALQDEYVRRNCSQMETNQIAGSRAVVGVAREQMEASLGTEDFES